jgi:peptide/nickel transport system substrate-binding protein
MKISLHWQILLAAIALALVAALLSFPTQTPGVVGAGFCTTRVPAAGGAFIEGVVGMPQMLNPLVSDGFPVDEELVSLIFDGLTRYDSTGELVPSLAEQWTVSEDGRSVQFRLREDAAWHDGQPVSADDVVFSYSLLQDDAYPGPAGVRELWQTVAINKIDERTVEFTLTEPYSPFLAATTRPILPAHLLEGITAVELPDLAFNLAPVGTGPFVVDGTMNWQENGRLRLLPNPTHWPQGTQIAALEFHFFPDKNELIQAFTAGQIHAINRVSEAALPQLAAQPRVRLFTAPDNSYTALWFNVRQSAFDLLRTSSGRQALVAALDRPALIDDALNGQGVPLNGPYLPSSWVFNPALAAAREYDGATAASLLDTAGWLYSSDGGVRQKDGQPLTLRLLALDQPQHRAVAEVVARQWRAAGVGAEVTFMPDVGALREALAEGAFDAALVTLTPPGDPDLYDFWSQEAILRGQNYTGWNNRRGSEALEQGRQTWDVGERRPLYETFQRLFDQDLPAVSLYQHVYTYALSPEVYEAEIGRIDQPRDRYKTLAQWFLLFRDVSVACPPQDIETK